MDEDTGVNGLLTSLIGCTLRGGNSRLDVAGMGTEGGKKYAIYFTELLLMGMFTKTITKIGIGPNGSGVTSKLLLSSHS